MTKSAVMGVPQNIKHPALSFNSADLLSVISISPNNNGSNLSAGTQTFTAAAGTVQTGGAAASWTAVVTDSRVIGTPTLVEKGQYLVTPTASANAATVGAGSSNATWNLRVETIKRLYVTGANDAIVRALKAVSTDTVARVGYIWVKDVNGFRQIGACNVPLSSGQLSTTPVVDVLNSSSDPGWSMDANGKRIIELEALQELWISVPAVTGGYQVQFSAQIDEY